MTEHLRFQGAKLALFLGGRLAVIRRDDIPGLAWAGYLDLPGGGRESGETAEACVIRETQEELGLMLTPEQLVWRRHYVAPLSAWFFAAHLPETCAAQVVFGDEGQSWHLMTSAEYLTAPDAIPHFQDRVRDYLQDAVSSGASNRRFPVE